MKNLIGSVPAVIFAVAALLLSHALTSGGALKLWRSEKVTLNQRLMVRRIVSTDRPPDNPDNFVHRSRPHNLGVYHTYQT